MEDHPLRARAEAHIAAMERRTQDDHELLAGTLSDWCWPGGPADRTEPVARTWVRQWRPARIGPLVVECTCAEGRCALCN